MLLSGLGFTPGDRFLVLEIHNKIMRDGYNRGDRQKIPCVDPECYPKASSILTKEVPIQNLHGLIVTYTPRLLIVIIHPKS
jgi:hypothetical protein